MQHTMVTYTVKPGREEENAALVRAVFDGARRDTTGRFSVCGVLSPRPAPIRTPIHR